MRAIWPALPYSRIVQTVGGQRYRLAMQRCGRMVENIFHDFCYNGWFF